jgi:nucleotide-binding universal stress UspA family protein
VQILNILDPGTKKYMQEHKLPEPEMIKKVEQMAGEFQEKYKVKATYLSKNVPIQRIRKISENEKVSFTFLAINKPEQKTSKIMKVVTTSPVPAFVIQDGVEFKRYKNILFPINDNPTSRQKAGWAMRFAKRTKAKIHIFSVNPASLGNLEKEKKQRAVIDSVEWFFARNHVDYVSKLAPGIYDEFDTDIINYAEKAGIDLSVIMISRKLFKPISNSDFKLIFNPVKIPVLCVNERNLFLGGGFA